MTNALLSVGRSTSSSPDRLPTLRPRNLNQQSHELVASSMATTMTKSTVEGTTTGIPSLSTTATTTATVAPPPPPSKTTTTNTTMPPFELPSSTPPLLSLARNHQVVGGLGQQPVGDTENSAVPSITASYVGNGSGYGYGTVAIGDENYYLGDGNYYNNSTSPFNNKNHGSKHYYNNSNNDDDSTVVGIGKKWLDAIQLSTAVCLKGQRSSETYGCHSGDDQLDVIDHSLMYQRKLMNLLLSSSPSSSALSSSTSSSSSSTSTTGDSKASNTSYGTKGRKNNEATAGDTKVPTKATAKTTAKATAKANGTTDKSKTTASFVPSGSSDAAVSTPVLFVALESVPQYPPPKFYPFRSNRKKNNTKPTAGDDGGNNKAKTMARRDTNKRLFFSSNMYSVIVDGDSSDEESDHGGTIYEKDYVGNPAGDKKEEGSGVEEDEAKTALAGWTHAYGMRRATSSTINQSGGRNGTGSESLVVDILRLLFSLYSCQSDLLARKARLLSKRKQWVDGVGTLQESINCLKEAMCLADSQIAKSEQELYSAEFDMAIAAGRGMDNTRYGFGSHVPPMPDYYTMSTGYHNHQLKKPNNILLSKQRLERLSQDSDAIHVASVEFMKTKDSYTKAAKKEKDRLENDLREMLIERERARETMGEERWNNHRKDNGKGSPHYVKRKAHEQELKGVKTALDKLATLEDMSMTKKNIRSLKDRTAIQINSIDSSTVFGSGFQGWNGSQGQQHHMSFGTTEELGEGELFFSSQHGLHGSPGSVSFCQSRYNGRRPSAWGTSYRPPQFPEASDYGWIFTGCDETMGVEFFEKHFVDEETGNVSLVAVQLDFFFATGDCSIFVWNPMNGPACIFSSQNGVSPDLYVKILRDPRDHSLECRYNALERETWHAQPTVSLHENTESVGQVQKKKKKNKSKKKSVPNNVVVGMNGWK